MFGLLPQIPIHEWSEFFCKIGIFGGCHRKLDFSKIRFICLNWVGCYSNHYNSYLYAPLSIFYSIIPIKLSILEMCKKVPMRPPKIPIQNAKMEMAVNLIDLHFYGIFGLIVIICWVFITLQCILIHFWFQLEFCWQGHHRNRNFWASNWNFAFFQSGCVLRCVAMKIKI